MSASQDHESRSLIDVEDQNVLDAPSPFFPTRCRSRHFFSSVVTACSCISIAALVVGRGSHRGEANRLSANRLEAGFEDKVELCEDAPFWTNLQADCKSHEDGHDPLLCAPQGWTCKAYESKGWCKSSPVSIVVVSMLGPAFNFPERACCACSGGIAPGETAKDASLHPASCKAHPGCYEVAGDCCPNAQGILLGCCDTTILAPPPTLAPSSPLVPRTTIVRNGEHLPSCLDNSPCPETAGDCCPTKTGSWLDCCPNKPPAVVGSMVMSWPADAPQCKAYKACPQIDDLCCPKADGVWLECCPARPRPEEFVPVIKGQKPATIVLNDGELVTPAPWTEAPFTEAGRNASMCKANPDCPPYDGQCCPTSSGVWLGCCSNRPGVKLGQAACINNAPCPSYPGDCCPNLQGEYLECCPNRR